MQEIRLGGTAIVDIEEVGYLAVTLQRNPAETPRCLFALLQQYVGTVADAVVELAATARGRAQQEMVRRRSSVRLFRVIIAVDLRDLGGASMGRGPPTGDVRRHTNGRRST